MAKKKGKQKDSVQPASARDEPRAPASGLPPIPEVINMLPKINTTFAGPAGGASPMSSHREAASGSRPADNGWGAAAQGNWGEHYPEHDEEDGEEGWGGAAHDDEEWRSGGSASEQFASPAMSGRQEAPADGSWLASRLANAFAGFGGKPELGSPAAAPAHGLARKSTLKKTPPAAPSPPASKHVAFGASPLHPSHYASAAPAPSPAPAAPPAPPAPAAKTNAQQPTHAMRARSQSYGGFASGWAVPDHGQPGHGAYSPSAAAWGQQPAHAAAQRHAEPAYPTQPRSAPAAPAQNPAWMQWAKEAQAIGKPKVATAIAASVPTAPQQPHSLAAAQAADARAALLQQQQRMQQAQLHSLLSYPALSKGAAAAAAQAHMPPGIHQRQMSAPAEAPAWQGAPKQDWRAWAAAHQGRSPGNPQSPPQMQPSQSWGSSEWTDVGRAGGGGGRGGWGDERGDGGWGKTHDDGGWGKTDDGAWGKANDDGGWGADAGGGAGWDDGAAWDNQAHDGGGYGKSGHKKSERRHSGSRSKQKHGGGGGGGREWGQSAGDGGWGQAAAAGGWGQTAQDGGWGQTEQGAGGWDHGHGDGKRDRGRSKVQDAWGQTSQHNNRWGTIEEEDEEEEEEYEEDEEEDEEYDDLDDMYTDPGDHHRHDKHKRQDISYQYRPPTTPTAVAPPGIPRAQFASFSPIGQHGRDPKSPLLPRPEASKTMNIASGHMTTVFELAPPRPGQSEEAFVWSQGQGLVHAQRALYGTKRRLAKERIYWGFNPDKDPRVSSLLRWIQAKSNLLATVGVQQFLATGQRGALFANADYRVNAPGGPTQPAFDWLTLQQLQPTLDKIFQESVVCYKPARQVIVFVFLLSKSGSSMAVWRRKLPVPESVVLANREAFARTLEALPKDKVVYVDEIPPKPSERPPDPPPKKRGFWRKFFGIFKSKKTK